ncbi:DUF5082 domain-containing protein [Bacillus aerolatus]|uniref:DUF5082 domain-containing protein n=1 Tax=Bacillus aerolatus TaxID=2653354 RepID=A0A6I1FI43_9BACI|nr:DUF5082 family protein [Bacillus aerolatus]KAB7705324.1 DUF5082 domain-containing protein [Bacillus aerolatus]
MSQASMLGDIQAAISGSIAAIQEKIERLEQAKRDINAEQDQCTSEIKKIDQPALGNSWTGSRADSFDDSRDAALKEMERIVSEEYDSYIQSIENKIALLKIELAAAQAASAVAQGAERLLDKGEEFVEDVGNTINSLKGWLFN